MLCVTKCPHCNDTHFRSNFPKNQTSRTNSIQQSQSTNSPRFTKSQRLNTVFTMACHLSFSLSHKNTVQATTSYFLKTHFNNILPSITSSSKCPLFFRFSHKTSYNFFSRAYFPQVLPSSFFLTHKKTPWP
jgi:hypothetical protein